MRGSIGEAAGEGQDRAELPMVLDAAAAKGLVQAALARRWSRRDRLMLRLPPRFMVAKPGSTISVGSTPSLWAVEQATVEGMSVSVRLRVAVQPIDSIAADSGRPIPNSDSLAGETRLALFDIPDLEENQSAGPTLYIAASSSSGSWNSRPVDIHSGASFQTIRTAPRKTVLGTALNQLAPAQSYLFDLANSLEIELADHGQWLENCDEDALVHGANLSVLGDELIQFGTVEPIGPGRFRLSKLLRGRRGSEWAMTFHSAGEAFALLEPNSVSRAELPPPMRGAAIRARARGLADGNANFVSRQVSGESLRPPSPIHLKAARSAAGDLQVNWVRRSRSGWAWLDEVDCPLGETRESYRVKLEGAGSTLEVETELTEATFEAAAIESMVSGTAILSVQQLGDHAASRPATVEIPLN